MFAVCCRACVVGKTMHTVFSKTAAETSLFTKELLLLLLPQEDVKAEGNELDDLDEEANMPLEELLAKWV